MGEKRKRGTISEEAIYSLVQRYSATTIITLLQEVHQFADVKYDWKALVKRTSTGISNAREYQMLWRHLAYREPLLENVNGTEPLDDDSDLEFELEASPPVSAEVSAQAAACVKILMPSDSGPAKDSVVEAPPAVEITNGQASNIASDKEPPARSACGKNATPLSLHKQPVSTAPSADGLDGNEIACLGSAIKKKRKLWSEEEDAELIAAVQKQGEGNWASILKGDFKHNRTASQLSQRWSTLKKRVAISNPGGAGNSGSSSQSEALLATRNAVASALRMPMVGSLSTMYTGAAQSTIPSSSSTLPSTSSEASPAPQASNQLQQPYNSAASQKEASTPSNKPRSTPKKPPASVKSSVSPNPLIQAAAFAAGGRIAAPAAAASLLKAAQSKNVVHIIPGGAKMLSNAKKTGQKSTGFRHSRPFMMPPPPGSSSMASNGIKFGSHRPRDCPVKLTGQISPPTIAQPSSSLQGNVERVNGKEIPTPDCDGSLTEEARGGNEMELHAAVDGDQSEASNVGRNVSNTAKDADCSQDKPTHSVATSVDKLTK